MTTAALIPDAGVYGQQQAYATQAYQKAKSNIQSQQQGWLQQYGMTGNYNATSGSYDNFHVDPYNQNGLIQQNRHAGALNLTAADDNAVARGLGHSGLGNQMGSDMRYQQGVADSNLGTQFVQGMGGYNQNLSDAANQYQQSMFQAENDAINRALQNQQFEQYGGGNQGSDTGANDGNPFTGMGPGEYTDPAAYNAWAQAQTPKTQADIVKAQVYAQQPGVTQIRKTVAKHIAQTKGNGKRSNQ